MNSLNAVCLRSMTLAAVVAFTAACSNHDDQPCDQRPKLTIHEIVDAGCSDCETHSFNTPIDTQSSFQVSKRPVLEISGCDLAGLVKSARSVNLVFTPRGHERLVAAKEALLAMDGKSKVAIKMVDRIGIVSVTYAADLSVHTPIYDFSSEPEMDQFIADLKEPSGEIDSPPNPIE